MRIKTRIRLRRGGDPEARVAQLLGLDFDGTIHAHDHWDPSGFGPIDVRVIRMAHAGGHVAYILTGNKPRKVAAALRELGISAKADCLMRRHTWDGGKDGTTVLVTHRKLDGTRLLADDRGFCFHYGEDPQLIISALEATLAARPVI